MRAVIRHTPDARRGEASIRAGTRVNLTSSASNSITDARIPVDGGGLASRSLERARRQRPLPASENAGVPASVNLTCNPTVRR